MAKDKGLGKGVSVLFGNTVDEDEKFFLCEVDKIQPNQHQPRTVFNDSDLEELSASIKENGIIQPLIVKRISTDNNAYELIAGERRLRASKMAGLDKVPVVVNDVEDESVLLELALIENIQRTDLNAIEEAEAYKKLIDKFNYTQEEAAKRVGKSRTTITNLLRLLQLPDFVQNDLIHSILSEGHARSLLRLVDNPVKLKDARDQIIHNNLSVRQTEQLIKKLKSVKSSQKLPQSNIRNEESSLPQEYCMALSNQLTNKFHSKVSIVQNGSRGKIEIEYYSADDLERVISIVLDEE